MPPMERGRRQRVHKAVDELWRCRPQTVAHRVCAPRVQRVRRHLLIFDTRTIELAPAWRLAAAHGHAACCCSPTFTVRPLPASSSYCSRLSVCKGSDSPVCKSNRTCHAFDSASGLTARRCLICPGMLMTHRAHQFGQRHVDVHQVSLCTVA